MTPEQIEGSHPVSTSTVRKATIGAVTGARDRGTLRSTPEPAECEANVERLEVEAGHLRQANEMLMAALESAASETELSVSEYLAGAAERHPRAVDENNQLRSQIEQFKELVRRLTRERNAARIVAERYVVDLPAALAELGADGLPSFADAEFGQRAVVPPDATVWVRGDNEWHEIATAANYIERLIAADPPQPGDGRRDATRTTNKQG